MSEAELIEIEKDIDVLDGRLRAALEDDDTEYSVVTLGTDRSERIVENMRRLIELARKQGKP